jgi:two-component system, NtrC family, response regulator AtoC
MAQLGRGQKPWSLSSEAKGVLRAAPWPGNVRQLRNALERAVILSDGPVLQAHLFPTEPTIDAPRQAKLPSEAAPTSDPISLEGLERRAIEEALAAVGGNRRAAAARLGIGLRTLYEKLKRYQMPE